MVDDAIEALHDYVDENFTKQENENMEFFTDIDDENSYTWRIKLSEQRFNLVYNYTTKKVTRVNI